LRRVEAVARSLGISLRAQEARSPTELDTVFSAMTTERADAVLVLADAMFLFQRKQIVELAARYRLPTVYQLREFPEIGGLMSYGTGLSDTHRRVAAKPGDLPVEQPTKFELVNLKTAKALGLTIPPSLLLRADQVIE